MSREPCRISDDPSYDYSDYVEGKGYYAPYDEGDPDAAYDEWRDQNPRELKTGSLDPFLTSHDGDIHANDSTLCSNKGAKS